MRFTFRPCDPTCAHPPQYCSTLLVFKLKNVFSDSSFPKMCAHIKIICSCWEPDSSRVGRVENRSVDVCECTRDGRTTGGRQRPRDRDEAWQWCKRSERALQRNGQPVGSVCYQGSVVVPRGAERRPVVPGQQNLSHGPCRVLRHCVRTESCLAFDLDDISWDL